MGADEMENIASRIQMQKLGEAIAMKIGGRYFNKNAFHPEE